MGTDEVGQGLLTVVAQITAEQFNSTVDRVRVLHGDTLHTPWDFASAASRSTWMTGNAIIRACQDAKQQIFKLAAPKLQASPDDLEISNGKIYPVSSPEKSINVGDLFGLGIVHEIGEILGVGSYECDYSPTDPETGYSPQGSPSWSYIAYGVEVEVNTDTGEVRVLKVNCAVDIGQPINWKMCEGQIEGCIGIGIGCALYEKFETSNGKLLNPNLVTYRMPTFMECPSGENIKSVSVVSPHPDGPYGAKALGEMGLVPFAAAVGNAVYNATGVRMTDAPLTRERVFKAIQSSVK